MAAAASRLAVACGGAVAPRLLAALCTGFDCVPLPDIAAILPCADAAAAVVTGAADGGAAVALALAHAHAAASPSTLLALAGVASVTRSLPPAASDGLGAGVMGAGSVGPLRTAAAAAAVTRLAESGALRVLPPAAAAAAPTVLTAVIATGPLSLAPALDALDARLPPGTGAAALVAAAAHAPTTLAPAAARALPAAADAAGRQAATAALYQLAAGARATHEGYRRAAATAPAWLAAPELAPALRPALDALFMAATAGVRGLVAATGALDGNAPGALAASLDVLASSAFARGAAPPPAHSALVTSLLSALPVTPGSGDALLARCPSPCDPGWATDAVGAARTHLLLVALSQAARTLPPAPARDAALPLALLYAVHPVLPVASAAVTLAGALLAVGAPTGVRDFGPALLDRVLDPTAPPPPPTLAPALGAALGSCPPGDPGAALVAARVAGALGAAAAAGDSVRVDALAATAAACLLASDAAGFGGAAGCLERALKGAPGAARAITALGAAIAAADDSVRKPPTVAWWQGLAARV